MMVLFELTSEEKGLAVSNVGNWIEEGGEENYKLIKKNNNNNN